jgi:hypothetical protein
MKETTMKTIARMLLRACPHCHGDLTLDEYERYASGAIAYECLQCGRPVRIENQAKALNERVPLAA